MISFADSNGAVWHPRFTFSTLRAIKEQAGVCLLSENAQEYLSDPANLVAVLYWSVEHEARERGVDEKAFAALIDAGPAGPMLVAVGQALNVFFAGSPEAESVSDSIDASDASKKV